jgi:hypothetical protein
LLRSFFIRDVLERGRTMKRLSVLGAAALIAATVIVLLSAGGASAARAKNYTAIAVSPSTVITTSGDAASQNGAMNKAWRKCDSAASQDAFYEGDCEVAVWVKNGWAAVAHERSLEGPPFASAPTWGSGWGATRNDAIYGARQDCEPRAGEPCDIERIERTPVL